MSPFIRTVKTSSGATGVQIVEKRGGVRRIVAHVGSAHNDGDLAVLMAAAREQLNPGQDELDLALTASSDPVLGQQARVVSTSSAIVWDVLADAYRHLGFGVMGDEAFSKLVLARIIEPTSKADTPRILAEVGVPSPHVNTLHAALRRCAERDYRGQLATAAMVMNDVTTLHFENEDDLRKVGVELHVFEGNKAETTTIVAVLMAFQDRHGVKDLVVVADAGMLWAINLNALEDAGFHFIVGSRIVKAPYDLADHFERHGNYFTDGKIPMRKARFLKVTGATTGLDQAIIDRARQLAGLKGYVTNLATDIMDATAVIGAYHDLWRVEESFRMTKPDLRARPVFHHQREAIEAHLTVVFAALAIARHLQHQTGVTIKKIVNTLRPLRSAVITIDGHTITAQRGQPHRPQDSRDARHVEAYMPAIDLAWGKLSASSS